MAKGDIAKPGRVQQDQPKNNNKMSREDAAKLIRKMRERDAEMVTGIFRNLESQATGASGGSLIFSYKMYPGDEPETYELRDGEKYSIPRGVARHLNNNCFYNEYQHLPREYGETGVRGAVPDGRYKTGNMQAMRKVHRFIFQTLEYSEDDIDLNPADLVQVTVTP